MKKPTFTFNQFLTYFPEVDLPVILREESAQTFSRENKALPAPLIDQFLAALQEEPTDEYTEYVPCLRLKNTGRFHALVYWKAHLMSYAFHLATFTQEGQLIAQRAIAGTYSDGESLIQSVGTIEEDWDILIVSGQSQQGQFEASKSRTIQLELLPDGTLVETQA